MMKKTLVSLFENSLKQNWELKAFSNYKGDTITYAGVADRILFLHSIFENCGLKKGDKIAIIGKNSINWAIAYLATVSYGAIIVPILPDFKPDDVHHIVNHSDSVLFFSADPIFDDLDESVMKNLYGVFSLTDSAQIMLRQGRRRSGCRNLFSGLRYQSRCTVVLQPRCSWRFRR